MAEQSIGNDKDKGLRGTAKELRDVGEKVGAAAVDKIEGAADRAKDAGLSQVQDITDTAQRVADELQVKSPVIAQYVRDAARRVEHIGDAIHDKSVGDLLTTATDYGRKQPMLFFAGAAVLGFALSRIVRSGLDQGGAGATHKDDSPQTASNLPASSGDTSSYGGASYAGAGGASPLSTSTDKPTDRGARPRTDV